MWPTYFASYIAPFCFPECWWGFLHLFEVGRPVTDSAISTQPKEAFHMLNGSTSITWCPWSNSPPSPCHLPPANSHFEPAPQNHPSLCVSLVISLTVLLPFTPSLPGFFFPRSSSLLSFLSLSDYLSITGLSPPSSLSLCPFYHLSLTCSSNLSAFPNPVIHIVLSLYPPA